MGRNELLQASVNFPLVRHEIQIFNLLIITKVSAVFACSYMLIFFVSSNQFVTKTMVLLTELIHLI